MENHPYEKEKQLNLIPNKAKIHTFVVEKAKAWQSMNGRRREEEEKRLFRMEKEIVMDNQ